jgi:adenylate cyclase
VTVALFALLIFRLPPGVALVTVMTYAVLAQVLIVRMAQTDDIDGVGFVVATNMLWNPIACAVVAAFVMERITRRSFANEPVIEAQTATIAAERERSDALLRNVLPEEIADRLKDRPGTIADDFDESTVLFADIVGFTPLAASIGAHAVVDRLNELFSAFDDLVDRYEVEKIKTIGDAYMVVEGVPKPRIDHVVVMANLALDMRDAMRTTDLQVRIGIATGPVVAGVISRRKFAYDLWGDTVNTAARMESHGVPGLIQVTEDVRAALGPAFTFEDRGIIEVKGKGATRAHLLIGRTLDAASTGTSSSRKAAAGAHPSS